MNLESVKAQVPTALTLDELGNLWHLARGKKVYEAGALLGASTIVMADAARFLVSVDPHDGYPRRDPSPTWELFDANLSAFGVKGKVQPVRATLVDAPPVAYYGFAFADLTGEHAVTKAFLEMTRHVPIVAVHDFARPGCEGATRAVEEHIKSTRRRVWRVDSLVVLEGA